MRILGIFSVVFDELGNYRAPEHSLVDSRDEE